MTQQMILSRKIPSTEYFYLQGDDFIRARPREANTGNFTSGVYHISIYSDHGVSALRGITRFGRIVKDFPRRITRRRKISS